MDKRIIQAQLVSKIDTGAINDLVKSLQNTLQVWQSTFYLQCNSEITIYSVLMFQYKLSYDAKKDVKTIIVYIISWLNVILSLHSINLECPLMKN